jgi:hypothetical protein
MRGELSTGKFAKRQPVDWYVEQGWEWDQIVRAIGVEEELADGVAIWDPAAGFGHAGSRLAGWGFAERIYLSDVVHNVDYDDFEVRPTFFSADFLELSEPPVRPVSIWCNPPYSYLKQQRVPISELFAYQALKLATHRVVFLMPNKWLGGQRRYRLFMQDHPPQMVLHFTQRPSMPPGDRIHLMGNRAYSGGMVDYCTFVWDVRKPTAPGETRTIWLPPLAGGGL